MGDPQGQIRYAVIANWGGAAGKPQLLCEVSSSTVTNAPNITKIILEKIRGDDHKLTYTYDKFLFHYVVNDRICYLCMADENLERRIPFDFLEETQKKFKAKYKDKWSMVQQAKDLKDFTGQLNERMEVANSGKEDTIRQIKTQIDETKGIMNKNIDELLGRGERIDLLIVKSNALESGATQFRSSARNLKWAMWKRKICMTALVVFILLIVIFIIVLIACGGFDFHKCKSSKKK